MSVGRSEAKAWARENVRGLWTTPMIPMCDDLSIDVKGIRSNVDRIVSLNVGGIGFGFSEPWYLTIAERMNAFDVFIDAVAGRVPCYVHALDYSVPETIRLIEHVEAAGADAVMLWTPLEFAKGEEAGCEWFEYIASQVDTPIFAYNTYHSGINYSISSIERLAALENVVALKDAVNDYAHTVAALEAVGDQILVSNPLEEYLPSMLQNTSQQVMLGTTSVFLMQSPSFQPINEYVALFEAGDYRAGWEKYYELKPLRDLWSATYDVLWVKEAAVHPLATIKYWMELIGMQGGPVRPPLKQLS
jgi:4-hydroxy-tetrahydrodipicolinate synthase